MTFPDEGLVPARRQRAASPPTAGPAESVEAEVARGQSAALLGALARMQLKLDVLAREQSEALSRVEARLEEIASMVTRSGSESGAVDGH